MEKVELFNLEFSSVSLADAPKLIADGIVANDKTLFIVTPNVDHIVTLQQDEEVKQIYKCADFVFGDGMPIVWLSRLIYGSNGLPERVTGADLLPALCKEASQRGLSVMFVGGKPNAAKTAGEKMQLKYPGLNVVGTYFPPYGFENNGTENQKLITYLNEKKPDILFFGVGNPKQEKWTYKYIDKINVGAVVCVGASIEFAAGFFRRAPIWMQQLGLEWTWRLLLEPRRLWRRYLIRDMKIFYLAWFEILKRKKM